MNLRKVFSMPTRRAVILTSPASLSRGANHILNALGQQGERWDVWLFAPWLKSEQPAAWTKSERVSLHLIPEVACPNTSTAFAPGWAIGESVVSTCLPSYAMLSPRGWDIVKLRHRWTPKQCGRCSARLGVTLPPSCFQGAYENLTMRPMICRGISSTLGPDASTLDLLVVDASAFPEDAYELTRMALESGLRPRVLTHRLKLDKLLNLLRAHFMASRPDTSKPILRVAQPGMPFPGRAEHNRACPHGTHTCAPRTRAHTQVHSSTRITCTRTHAPRALEHTQHAHSNTRAASTLNMWALEVYACTLEWHAHWSGMHT